MTGPQLAIDVPEARAKSPLKEKCPKCGAPPGEHCTTETGEYAASTHKARALIASYLPVKS